jgi:hypothetical protein
MTADALCALTIMQPWASLIVAGAKSLEFRPRPAPAAMIGKRIVLHAGRSAACWKDLAWLRYALTVKRGAGLGLDDAALAAERCEHWARAPGTLPLGAGLGTAVLSASFLASEVADLDAELRPDLWAWRLAEVKAWPRPINAQGQPGFWWWEEGVPDAG